MSVAFSYQCGVEEGRQLPFMSVELHIFDNSTCIARSERCRVMRLSRSFVLFKALYPAEGLKLYESLVGQ